MIKEDIQVSLEEAKKFYPEEKINKRGKDLTGLQIGTLKVLYKTKSEKIGKTTKSIWVCQCQNCNNIIKRRADYLYQNRIQSCGCLNFPGPIDIKNKKYGKLTAIRLDHYDENNGYIWECQCECGNKCYVSYSNLNTNKILICPLCSRRKAMIKLGKNGSKGSNKIKQILEDNNIKYELEKGFPDLKDKNFLFYDFYLPKYNILIEYDGQQHFNQGSETSMMSNEKKYKEILLHDKIKNEYAIKNNILLIRIPYYDIDNIQINDLIMTTSNYLVKND